MTGIGVGAAVVLVIPNWWALLICVLLLQLQLLVDCSDGEIARWRGTSSASGIYIDRVGHYLTEAALPIGLGIHVDGGVGHIGKFTMIGLATAVIVVLTKSFGDLVHTARAAYGLPVLADDATKAAPRPGGLRSIRSALRYLPFFRAFVAVEFSLIALVVGSIDALANAGGAVLQVAVVVLSCLAVVIMLGRLTAILTSDRLRA